MSQTALITLGADGIKNGSILIMSDTINSMIKRRGKSRLCLTMSVEQGSWFTGQSLKQSVCSTPAFFSWEETDFCFRAKRAGFEVISYPKARLWHKVSASFTGGKAHTTYFFWRNRLLWIERNFNGPKRFYYLLKLIVKNMSIFYLSRLFWQTNQLVLRKKSQRNTDKITRYNATLYGIRDYIMRRFGPGRSKNFMNCH